MLDEGIIIIYKLTELEQIERDKLCRELLGRTVQTHKGKYTHHVRGILDRIPHIRVGRGIIIIEILNKKSILDIFNKYGVTDIFIREITLTKEDREKLREK